uniref:GG11827 n=1 Tax=Drosophila erecta TaxID=7220 RepID=B3P514_DROER
MQILTEIEQIIPHIITTRTISEARSISCSEDAKEEPFQLARSVLVAFAVVVYCSYLNMYRHRKSFRRKPPTEHFEEWIGTFGALL